MPPRFRVCEIHINEDRNTVSKAHRAYTQTLAWAFALAGRHEDYGDGAVVECLTDDARKELYDWSTRRIDALPDPF